MTQKKVRCSWCKKEVDEEKCQKYEAMVTTREFDFTCPECQDLFSCVTRYLDSVKDHDPMDDDPTYVIESERHYTTREP